MTGNPKHGVLPDGWEWRELGEVAEFINGKAFKPSEWGTEGLPIVRIQNLTNINKPFNYYDGDYENRYFIRNEDILISWSASLGVFKWNRGDALLNQHIFKAEPNNEFVDRDFFFYVVQTKVDEMKQRVHGSTMKHITKRPFLSLKIPLPPLPTQHKIVEILERADTVRRKRQEADEKTARILQAAFVKMFGDPARNEMGWNIAKIGDIVKSCRYGPRFYNQPYSTEGVPILRTTDISESGEISFETAPLMEVSSEEIQKYRLEKGDIVITRSGTLGRCALFDRDDFDCIPGAFLIQFRFSGRVLPIYMKHYIMSHFVQSMIKSMGRTVAQPNINANELKSIKVLISPLELQRKFARLVERVEAMRGRQTVSRDHIGEMFKGLMQKAFRGELVA